MIGAAAPASSGGFNPLSIFSLLETPFQWVLQQLTNFFHTVGPLNAIGAFGLSVIVLTIGIRAVLFPVFGWQLRTSRRIQAEQRLVAPQLQELRKKYKKEPQRLSQEMNALYKEHGISPFSSLTGCIPALVQMPVLIGLYQSISAFTGSVSGTIPAGSKGFLWISDVTKTAAAGLLQRCAARTFGCSRATAAPHPPAPRRRLHLRAVADDDAATASRHDRSGTLHAGRHQADVVHLPGHDLRVQLPVPPGARDLLGDGHHVHGRAAVPPPRVERARGSLLVPGCQPRDGADDSADARQDRSGRGARAAAVVATSGKNGTRNATRAAGPNGTKPKSGAVTDEEPPVRSQSATARSLARPNRPNRRRRRR